MTTATLEKSAAPPAVPSPQNGHSPCHATPDSHYTVAEWAAFEETGDPFNRGIADKFRTILLSTGNETDRVEAYRQFRGRDPDVTALLKRRGFPIN